MIGHEMNDNQIGLIEQSVTKWNKISPEEQKQLDTLISGKNRFFSIFDEDTRMAMYEHCRVHKYQGRDRIIVQDVEDDDYGYDEEENEDEEAKRKRKLASENDETKRIHILLRGNIHIVQQNDELDI